MYRTLCGFPTWGMPLSEWLSWSLVQVLNVNCAFLNHQGAQLMNT